MDKLYELRHKLCNELKSYAGKELSASTLTMVDTLAHAIKNIDKVIVMSEKEASYLRGTDDELSEMVRGIPDETTKSVLEAILAKVDQR